ncbi:muramidase [Streptomyces sp. NHF165]|uniref:GH25 family lysozyme n=1 Tax=Streptomyces TaxID=1883 RepID=UPI00132E9B83|nr:GH25 family lysozyme [Streptomyces sp. NHF165]QHF97940.1 muramidase [Streptomyces sp. NHF165]
MTVRGIDVSSYQSTTYSTKGLDFVFVKATEGTSYINPKMSAQAARARKAGLVVGFYHFLRPGSMTAQAAYFVEKCASQHGDPLFADWEDPGVTCAQKDAFLAEVKRLRGETHRVGLYCNTDYWLHRDTTSTAGDALWIAHYGVGAGRPGVQAKWLFHQYTDNPVDTNVGDFADRAALAAWAGAKADAPAPPKKPKPTPRPGAGGTYTVRSGDTLSEIAARHGVSMSALLAANPQFKKRPDVIHPGDRVTIPGKGGGTTTYKVRAGDTLSEIALRYGTSVAKLAKANGLADPDRIFAGQSLTIPQ